MGFETILLLSFLFFGIAVLYSSAGFGGGSSYLAILTLTSLSFFEIRTIALICNLVVVSSSTYLYYKNGWFNFKFFLPFIICSIPLAYLGASLKLSESIFFIILGTVLIASSISLFIQSQFDFSNEIKKRPAWLPYSVGSFVGFLSGLVGIGGGIFLSPILNHLRSAQAIQIAALSSFFILVNSLSGILSLQVNGHFAFSYATIPLIIAVLAGGQIGSRWSIKRLNNSKLKLITSILIFVVGIRVLIKNGLGWI